ncbi:PREDICTED: rho GTPase-activating protein SYDE1, partial [Phaethon lepturus]|uniref:rho GTPase-activating protein SYDE1 n=1 Tax=Phaethon lepturus TaxID=97097 RepID=UPI0005308D74
MPIPCVSAGTGLTTPSPPASPKKGRSLNKVKSPGTVRRLSMKMKKLPELRRKLSLRSTQLLAKAGARAEPEDGENGLDVGAFRPYSCGETPPRCGQHISGLVSVHLHGVRDLKPPRAEAREVFCVLQVDAANRARTALLPCKTAFLGLNHTFNLELEGARHLKVMVFSWDPTSCCHGTVVLPHIFRGCRAQQLAVRLQPRGVLYSKFTLVEQWESPGEREPRVFGILKDYLRELPTPLITPTLYHVVLEAMAKRPPRSPPGERDAVTLLDCLPDVEK